MSKTAETAHPTDVQVGQRIRLRRHLLEITQEQLAAHLGLTFQQVQKYEKGANRVSASKLFDIAQFLDTPLDFFFEGLPDSRTSVDTAKPCLPGSIVTLAGTPGGLLVAEAFVASKAQGRAAIVAVASLAKAA